MSLGLSEFIPGNEAIEVNPVTEISITRIDEIEVDLVTEISISRVDESEVEERVFDIDILT